MFRILAVSLMTAGLSYSVDSGFAADQDLIVRAPRVKKHYERIIRYGCPDGYGCYPLYGAYGPYGGRAFWSSFSYVVPPRAAEVDVIYSRY